MIKHGDYSKLAKYYPARPDYGKRHLNLIFSMFGQKPSDLKILDLGAGTGKLTRNLHSIGVNNIIASEPNEEMRKQGKKHTNSSIEWFPYKAEDLEFKNNTFDWVFMGSCFHWMDLPEGLYQIQRVLKKDGLFTAIYNPRDLERSEKQKEIDKKVTDFIKSINRESNEVKRVSSGSKKHRGNQFEYMKKGNHFEDIVLVETNYDLYYTRERYINIWKSVNDLQVQAGEKWPEVLSLIQDSLSGDQDIHMPYKIRSWTGQKKAH